MTNWNFAAVWETVASVRGDAPALVHGSRVITWSAFEQRAAGVAASLLAAGLGHQAKVALYLRNVPEYMEGAFAAMKAGLVPVNTNYRYQVDELQYLWENADVEAVLFQADYRPLVDSLRERLPGVKLWLQVGGLRTRDGVVDYETAAGSGARVAASDHLGAEDVWLIYTGGTTGMPKGVIWRQHDIYLASNTAGDPAEADLESVAQRLSRASASPVGMPAAPLMHGTGFVFATTILGRGGTLATADDPSFDAARLLDTIDARRVSDLCIVGDAFARPIADALDADPARWDLACLRTISSSGMVWSAAVKQRLLAHLPEVLLVDFLNSSEASGMGRAIASNRQQGRAAFKLGDRALVVDDDGRPLVAGAEGIGRLAVRGLTPLGYYKDPERSARTFPVIDGVRYAIPGDLARQLADGGIELLGRGSTCINTGGEKVFPEEVEAAIKTCAGVRDALVVGLPDPRFGEVVAAVVEGDGSSAPDADAVIAHVRAQLARHKAPRHVMVVSDVQRTVSGKADYPAVRARLLQWLGASPPSA
ncbi:MAG: AMP-binding protein [Burkholderiaceae bacterium]